MRTLPLFAAAIALAAIPAAADETVTHPFSTSMPRGATRRVIVDIPAGEVSVRNSTTDQIRASGEVQRDFDGYRERAKQQAIVDDIGVEIFVNGKEALIRRSYGPKAQSWSSQSWHSGFHLTVEVPRGVDVDLETHYGEVTIDGEFGNVDLDLRAGEIHARFPRASVRELNASVRVGEVHADFGEQRDDHEGVFPSSTHFFNAAGRARVNLHTTFGELHVTLTR